MSDIKITKGDARLYGVREDREIKINDPAAASLIRDALRILKAAAEKSAAGEHDESMFESAAALIRSVLPKTIKREVALYRDALNQVDVWTVKTAVSAGGLVAVSEPLTIELTLLPDGLPAQPVDINGEP